MWSQRTIALGFWFLVRFRKRTRPLLSLGFVPGDELRWICVRRQGIIRVASTLGLICRTNVIFLFLVYSGSCMRPAANKKEALQARHTVHSKVQKHVHALKRRFTLYQDVQLSTHADVILGAFRCYVLMHLTAFRLLYLVALCGRSSKFGFYCGFLFNSPHDISQSMWQ